MNVDIVRSIDRHCWSLVADNIPFNGVNKGCRTTV